MAASIVSKALKEYPADAKLIGSHLKDSKKNDDFFYAYNLVGASLTRRKINHGLDKNLGDLSKDFTGDSWSMNFWNASRSSQERILAHLQNRKKVLEGALSCDRCKRNRLTVRVRGGQSDESQNVLITCISCGYTKHQS